MQRLTTADLLGAIPLNEDFQFERAQRKGFILLVNDQDEAKEWNLVGVLAMTKDGFIQRGLTNENH